MVISVWFWIAIAATGMLYIVDKIPVFENLDEKDSDEQ